MTRYILVRHLRMLPIRQHHLNFTDEQYIIVILPGCLLLQYGIRDEGQIDTCAFRLSVDGRYQCIYLKMKMLNFHLIPLYQAQ